MIAYIQHVCTSFGAAAVFELDDAIVLNASTLLHRGAI